MRLILPLRRVISERSPFVMRSKHTLSALLASALLFAGAGSALAASVQIVLPEETVPGGSRAQLTVTTDVPGFLTLTLDGPSGSVTLCENQEVHTADNTLIFTVSDEDGAPLDVGAYTVNGELIDQFGQTAASLSGQLTVGVPTAQMADEADSDEVPADETPADTKQSAQPAAQPAAAKPAAAQTSAGSDVEYVASTATVMGDEGYEIGVGVSDTAAQEDSGYWGLTADSSDAEIWAALTRTMVSVDVKESESAYIYNSTSKGKKLGSVSGLSQGLNLIEDLDDGWSLVEAYRNEDGAFVRGYIRTKTLRTVEPNTLYGIVVDKAAQTLTVYKNGERLGSCAVSTGLATAKYLHRETPAGEYITVTRRGTIENAGGYSKYTIRISGNYYLCEIPTTKKNGKDFSIMEDALGSKASRGNICLAHDASTDGGINAEWIWNITEENKKIKVLVFDDKDRSLVPAGSK